MGSTGQDWQPAGLNRIAFSGGVLDLAEFLESSVPLQQFGRPADLVIMDAIEDVDQKGSRRPGP